eukprot:scaffold157558_cov35-Tisochrysis_lutea.AAC.3
MLDHSTQSPALLKWSPALEHPPHLPPRALVSTPHSHLRHNYKWRPPLSFLPYGRQPLYTPQEAQVGTVAPSDRCPHWLSVWAAGLRWLGLAPSEFELRCP